MKKMFFVCVACVFAIETVAAGFWQPFRLNGGGADMHVESVDRESFFIRGKRTDKKVANPGCIAIGTLNQETWTNTRLAMSVRSENGRKVAVTVSLSFRRGKEAFTKSMKSFTVSGKGWRELSWSLDNDFALGDGSIKVFQAKVIAWMGSWASGEEGGIEVRNFRIAQSSDAVRSSRWIKGDRFVNVPAEKKSPPARSPDALAVYFAFDNEDVVPHPIKGWKGEVDQPQFGGFREIMLEHTDAKAYVETDLSRADVIVYSRCRPDSALASNIVAAVRERGVPLYAAGEVRDPEIDAILPCEIGREELEDLPRRERIVPGKGWLSGLSDAAFGIYRTIRAKDGAKTLLSFADGTPALVAGRCGKGVVMYNMLTIGSSLVPGKESPDAFFIRAIGQLSRRNLPERERAMQKPDAEGWYEGVGEGAIGHFGWNRGSELPVENLSSRFVVSKGESWYEMHVPREKPDVPRKMTFVCRNIDQMAFGGDVSVEGEKAYRIDASLAYPGIRWDIYRGTIEVFMRNQSSFVAVPGRDGIRISDFTTAAAKDIAVSDMSAPWILVYNGDFRDSPLLLVLQKRPAKVEVMRSGVSLEGLRIKAADRSVGVVVPTRIHGSAFVDTTKWTREIPSATLGRIREWVPRAFAYPIASREKFKIDEKAKRVRIRDEFSFLFCRDDWGTRPQKYAALPPVATLLAGRGTERGDVIVEVGEGAEDSRLVTRAGNLWIRPDSSIVEWSTPLFKPDLSFLPHVVGEAKVDAAANKDFSQGVKYSSGATPMNHKGQKFGRLRKGTSTHLNMHGILLGMGRCTPNPYIYSEENRRLLRRRLAWRLLEPLEVLQYKMAVAWRQEPFSGSRYTIYMDSPRRMANEFEPQEYGSKTIYGDSNETVRMIAHALQIAADRFGQSGLIKANWDAISRHVASYELFIDDWGILASGCLELGGSGSVDMLNGEFSCWMSFARLAEIAGDEPFRAQAFYRAARRMCPTLARQRALAYFKENALAENIDMLRMSVGFGEGGAVFQRKTTRILDIDLFDMSQGTPQDLVSLYSWYGWGEMRRDYFPYVAEKTPANGLNYLTLSFLSMGSDLPDAEIRSRLDALVARTLERKKEWRDWPAMDSGSFIEWTLHRPYRSPYVTDCRDAFVHDAVYDPKTKTVTLDVTPGERCRIAVAGRDVPLRPSVRQSVTVAAP